MHRKVEGVSWTVSEVAKFGTADAFVSYFMADASMYAGYKPERKEKALRLAYAACVPEVPQPVAEPEKEVAPEPEKPKTKRKTAASEE